MTYRQLLGAASAALLIIVLALAPASWAQSKFKTLYKFTGGDDGAYAQAAIIFDAAGNIYSTATYGGAYGYGNVFELSPNADGSWTEKVLHQFSFSDGALPADGLIFDQLGNLYGTATWGGAYGTGNVFELSPNVDGSWTEKVLYNFTGGHDGGAPWLSCLIFDGAGNLYGTTYLYGNGYGVVFRLAPNQDGSWTESVLHTFGGWHDGTQPSASLVFDHSGNLYGSTRYGGAHGGGTVFKMAPNTDGSWTESILYSFTSGKDGAEPSAGLILDQADSLYGTTYAGGNLSVCNDAGCGVAFQLKPNKNGGWTEGVLHTFSGGRDGSNPDGNLIFDSTGSLYGTTLYGGTANYGVVFKLAPNSIGGWTETVLHTFNNNPGSLPVAGLVFDAAGNLYGTTAGQVGNGNCSGTTCGSVFEITP